MLGDKATLVPRGALSACVVVVRDFVFFAGCEGEGRTGELNMSNVSIVSSNGGVFGRSRMLPNSAGSVCDRSMGARLRLFVTLGGRSCIMGDGDFSRIGCGTGAGLLGATGDESKSITSI